MKLNKILTLPLMLLGVMYSATAGAQGDTLKLAKDDPIIAMIDSLMRKDYLARDPYYYKADDYKKHNLPEGTVPEVSDSVIGYRINEMNKRTPFEYAFNDDVLSYIRLYIDQRKSFTSICMGRSAMYFPLFEEKLAKHGMPLELKYLSVIESALNPTAKSRAGAMGLWQFMPATGKMYGLEMSSYIDERCDPIKATESACILLKTLYSYYNDWSMALAAYNAGPGTVNRAIRRSGGKMTYWEIRPFLPKETQGYVPAFIAVNYAMEYAAEHNIIPREADKRFFEYDTVHIKEPLYFKHLASVLKLPEDLLKELNPIYKTGFIPKLDEQQYIYLPVESMGDFLANEDTLYNWYKKPRTDSAFVAFSSVKTHVVKKGEYLSLIANNYKVTVDELIAWNNLKSNTLYSGQKLNIHQTTHVPVASDNTQIAQNPQPKVQAAQQPATNLSADRYYYYTIQSGDTLWDIAQKKGVSLTQIKQLNGGLNERNLKVGAKIKIGVKS
jgi:membrane-bound lytic murein transglycosylase D